MMKGLSIIDRMSRSAQICFCMFCSKMKPLDIRFNAYSWPPCRAKKTEPNPPSPSTATNWNSSSFTIDMLFRLLMLGAKCKTLPLASTSNERRFLMISASNTKQVMPAGPACTVIMDVVALWKISVSPKWQPRCSSVTTPSSLTSSKSTRSLDNVPEPFSTTYHNMSDGSSPFFNTTSPGPNFKRPVLFLASSARSARTRGVNMCTSSKRRQNSRN
mmetsp:Transcript_6914/g.19691  ORF Transcript_6914/g.19691 Transcript_6914/m.19691 type:complete len:216 (-) Transcript_6914:1632-2279(-)